MQAVILAAGKGTRLQPFTFTRPKAMAPIVGKPIIAWVIDSFKLTGIEDFIIVVSADDNTIQDYFIKNPVPGINIQFAKQAERKGMAHALGCAAEFIKEDFVLAASDQFYDSKFIRSIIDSYRQKELDGILALHIVNDQEVSKTGIVQIGDDGLIKTIIEKPSLEEAPSRIANRQFNIFKKEILSTLPKIPLSKRGEYEIQDAIQLYINAGKKVGGEFFDHRFEVTSMEDLLDVNIQMLNQYYPQGFVDQSVDLKSAKITQPVYISKGVTIGENCNIGPNVYLEEEAVVGKYSTLQNCLVLKTGTVNDKSSILKGIIL